MSGRRFYEQIVSQKGMDENPENLIVMIDILAYERSIATGDWLTDEVYKYAADIFCFFLDPIKSTSYRVNIISLRNRYKGIIHSRKLRNELRKIFTTELLEAKSSTDAIEIGFERLFEFDFDINSYKPVPETS